MKIRALARGSYEAGESRLRRPSLNPRRVFGGSSPPPRSFPIRRIRRGAANRAILAERTQSPRWGRETQNPRPWRLTPRIALHPTAPNEANPGSFETFWFVAPEFGRPKPDLGRHEPIIWPNEPNLRAAREQRKPRRFQSLRPKRCFADRAERTQFGVVWEPSSVVAGLRRADRPATGMDRVARGAAGVLAPAALGETPRA